MTIDLEIPPSSQHSPPRMTVPEVPASDPETLLERYLDVRRFTERLCEPLENEDFVIQTMPNVSPAKWHLAHTTWFFETFLLEAHAAGYEVLHPKYNYLFNSYYNAVGYQHCRPKRGLISRPTVSEVYAYRRYVDDAVTALIRGADGATIQRITPIIELGRHHERQHQELMVTDLKHVFSENPLFPAYRERRADEDRDGPGPAAWVDVPGGLVWIGHDGDGFSFDNELPRHREWLEPYRLADRLITNGEYLEFIEDGGYDRHDLWLSLGWATIQEEGWSAPLYWQDHGDGWKEMTLSGVRELDPAEPVCHVSYFEADAFARWAGARLPTEAEWETAARVMPSNGEPAAGDLSGANLAEDERFHPAPAPAPAAGEQRLRQLYGDVWEWTRSSYAPYPGYEPADGALGEYNGKFMCNQYVLRGGSCATAADHLRTTYRNFFQPESRWQFTGIRLAADAR